MRRPVRIRIARAGGFSLIMAVFLLVSLAAIGAALLTVSTSQTETSIADEGGALVFLTARSGSDWGAYELLRNPGGAYATACNAGAQVQNLSFGGGLAGTAARVACTSLGTETEGADSVRVYQLVVTACNQALCPGTAGAGYLERQLQLTLTN